MKLKMLRNLGREWPFHEEPAAGKPGERYMEKQVYDVPDELAERLLKENLAVVDDGHSEPATVRGIAPQPAIANPADFNRNPNTDPKATKKE